MSTDMLPEPMLEFLQDAGLWPHTAPPPARALSGGVSSDIWFVDLNGRGVCIKRALPRLRVQDEWLAPVERNHYEYEWLTVVTEFLPAAVPELLGHDPSRQMFAMAYLEPCRHPVWKSHLISGVVDTDFAATVGDVLGQVHSHTAGLAGIASRFRSDALFEVLRLEPYLRATGQRHPEVSDCLNRLADRTAATHRVLVHGDVSPKNILVGPEGPVFVDAECAWYGDPAFDPAFCLTHLLLKMCLVPGAETQLAASVHALASSYLEYVNWEQGQSLEARIVTLIPALLLARIDGKSPVEYLTDEAQRSRVRNAALGLLLNSPKCLDDLLSLWRARMAMP